MLLFENFQMVNSIVVRTGKLVFEYNQNDSGTLLGHRCFINYLNDFGNITLKTNEISYNTEIDQNLSKIIKCLRLSSQLMEMPNTFLTNK